MPALALQLSLRPVRAANAKRMALVIGNASYATSPLRNSVNDARLVSTTLRGLGYEVLHREDMALQTMIELLRDWVAGSAAADVRLLYFAGHGAQYRGQNFLLPVDAVLAEEGDIPRRAVNGSDLIDRLSRTNSGVSIVVFDACRNAPLPLDPAVPRTRGNPAMAASGLAPELTPRGTLVAYSTSPGAAAPDGKDGNSAYTKHFVAQLNVPGVPVETLFKRVRNAVARETGNRQVPWETSSLVGDVCLNTTAGRQCGSASSVDSRIDLSRAR
jgi:uncharacterized caspase-like protein